MNRDAQQVNRQIEMRNLAGIEENWIGNFDVLSAKQNLFYLIPSLEGFLGREKQKITTNESRH